MVGHNVGHL